VVRNATNQIVANQSIGVKISIIEGSLAGTTAYAERHTTTTNANGLFTIEAGGGTPTIGTFATINWGNGSHYIKSEIDITGGTNYTLSGTMELLSVPYALYATNGISPAQTTAITAQAATNTSLVASNTTMQAQITAMQAQINVLQKPQLITAPIGDLTASSATSGGTITSTGLGDITARGVVWSTSTSPTIALTTKTTDGSGTGSFASAINGLNENTTYYVRAYATNNFGTSYGAEVSFTTMNGIIVLATYQINNVTATSAISGGEIITDGGAAITERGVVWSTSPSPTIALAAKTIDDSGPGSFASAINGLNDNTNYYVRAYATNNFGTVYGTEESFTTMNGIIVLATNQINTVAFSSAISGGEIITDGGAAITERGVVWSTSSSPTIALSTKTIDGSGPDSFSSAMTELNPTTTYYVRAYATNSFGTVYGTEVSFTTLDTPNITNGTQYWQNTNLDVATYSDGTVIPEVTDPTQWRILGTGGWCYYNNDAATGATYGRLYNWYAVAGIWNEASKTDASQRKQLAPTGYHVPSDAEWTTLTDYLGGDGVAAGKMKATTLWNSPNQDATNSSGFTGLPGGYRSINGTFTNVGANGRWWSSSEYSTTLAWYRNLYYDTGSASRNGSNKASGCSVRCLRD
jgi:uncharacterized protein (TIGR02145 family)